MLRMAARAACGMESRGLRVTSGLEQSPISLKPRCESCASTDELARAGQPVWLYRFAYVSQAQRGENMSALHAYEIPFTMNISAALVGDKVTPTDKAMADLVSSYWAQFGLTGDPNGAGRPNWPRYDPAIDRIIHFSNSGVIVGIDPLKSKLDLWQKVWTR